jgi:predicted NodU family carbamoyl transferase
LDELRVLFGLLSKSFPKDPSSKIKINHVKRCGPQPFASSTHQEDAYEYLSKLFETIENYMKNIPGAI